MTENSSNRRRFFRLRYPTAARPQIRFVSKLYDVTELSEKGLRFLINRDRKQNLPESVVRALILFPNSETCQVYGTVHRVESHEDEEELVLNLVEPFPLARMVAEQRRILKDFREETLMT